jgi:hypothetical protein
MENIQNCDSGLTALPPSMSLLSRQCGTLSISHPYWPPRPVTGIALLFLLRWDIARIWHRRKAEARRHLEVTARKRHSSQCRLLRWAASVTKRTEPSRWHMTWWWLTMHFQWDRPSRSAVRALLRNTCRQGARQNFSWKKVVPELNWAPHQGIRGGRGVVVVPESFSSTLGGADQIHASQRP